MSQPKSKMFLLDPALNSLPRYAYQIQLILLQNAPNLRNYHPTPGSDQYHHRNGYT